MMIRYLALTAIASAAIVAVLTADISDASACQPPPCDGPSLYEQGEIPANARGVVWTPEDYDSQEVDPSTIELVKIDGQGNKSKVPVTISDASFGGRWFISPKEGFLPDSHYKIAGTTQCPHTRAGPGDEDPERHFSTTHEVPLSESLGTLAVSQSDRGRVAVEQFPVQSNCSQEIDEYDAAQIAIELRPTDSMEAWTDLLYIRTRVRRPSGDWHTPAMLPPKTMSVEPEEPGEVIYTVCDGDSAENDVGLAPGKWQVRFEATREDRDRTWTSQPVTVNLTCDGENGEVETDTGIQQPDTGLVDAGTDSDAGRTTEDFDFKSTDEAPGCGGCSTRPGTPPGGNPTWLLLAAGLLAVRRQH